MHLAVCCRVIAVNDWQQAKTLMSLTSNFAQAEILISASMHYVRFTVALQDTVTSSHLIGSAHFNGITKLRTAWGLVLGVFAVGRDLG